MTSVVRVVDGGNGYTKVEADDGQTYTLHGNLAWRNNNPGNIRYGDYAKSRGAVGESNGFAVFPDYDTGSAAQEHLQFESPNYRDLTVSDAISRYAPAEDHNDPQSYAAQVANALGISTSTPLSALTPEQRQTYLAAQSRVEGYVPGRVLDASGNPASVSFGRGSTRAPASGGAFDPTGGIVPAVPQPNLPAPAPLKPASGGWNLGSMVQSGLGFLGGQAQQLGGEIGNVASKVPLPSQQQVVQAIMASPSARGAIIDPMIASLFTDKRGTIATNPNKYGSTPQERQYNAARREALANGGPLPSQGVTAVATALSTRPPVAAQQGGGGGGGGNGGGAGGGGGTITGSATGRTYNVGQVYSNGNGSYMATENGFKRL